MNTEQARQALEAARRLEIRYSGTTRVVEVHAVGATRSGELIMRAWQVRGGSSRGEASGWKLFKLCDASMAKLLDEKSEAPRKGYRRGDPAMHSIAVEI